MRSPVSCQLHHLPGKVDGAGGVAHLVGNNGKKTVLPGKDEHRLHEVVSHIPIEPSGAADAAVPAESSTNRYLQAWSARRRYGSRLIGLHIGLRNLPSEH